MAQADLEAARPLSPHLQVFRPIITMVMSIMHRITGVALYFGTVIVIWWLAAAASGPAYFDYVAGWLGSPLGLLVLFGYTWALFHHMLGGLRHFIWDTGAGLEKETATKMAWASIIGSIALTLIAWVIGFVVMG